MLELTQEGGGGDGFGVGDVCGEGSSRGRSSAGSGARSGARSGAGSGSGSGSGHRGSAAFIIVSRTYNLRSKPGLVDFCITLSYEYTWLCRFLRDRHCLLGRFSSKV